MLERAAVARRFAAGDAWFASSPLYQVLARQVVCDNELLDLAAQVRAGQQPANMLMAATHLIVLKDPEQPFARFFASVRGDDAQPPAAAGGEFADFCRKHRATIVEILRTRLVQTNEASRGVSVRLAMHEVARRVPGPVTFLEIGPSAGIQLCFDQWAVELAGRRFGPDSAPLTLRADWRGDGPPPDLNQLPPIGQRLGVDLHPVDARDPDQRQWLQALIWPEHRDRIGQLRAALDAVADNPPTILQGDAIDLLPDLDASRLPDDIPLVVFHAMVRIHVPANRRNAFDRAIDALAQRRRLLHISLELPPADAPYDRTGHLLALRDSCGPDRDLALAEGHGRWIAPLPKAAAP